MGKHAGAHKAEKRRKELQRQKKQEEKRKKRLQRGTLTSEAVPDVESEIPAESEPEIKDEQLN